MPISRQRIQHILTTLNQFYPNLRTELTHQTPFQLLIATILSSQCTDRQVNLTTPALFEKFPTPQAMSKAPLHVLEKLIHSVGFFHTKAKYIQNTAKKICQDYQGNVPGTLEELLQFPGVGRKTANVILGQVFGIPAVVVDTHVLRISPRLGFCSDSVPEHVEQALMKQLPPSSWNPFSLQLIQIGRRYCIGKNPRCQLCPLHKWCEYARTHSISQKKQTIQ